MNYAVGYPVSRPLLLPGGFTLCVGGASRESNNMNILHIAMSRGWNAQIANALLIINHQVKRNDTIHAVTLHPSAIETRLASFNEKVHIHPILHHHTPDLLRVLVRLLTKHSIDAVHIHGANGDLFLLAALFLSGRKVQVVRSMRDRLTFEERIAFLRWKLMDYLLVPNDYVKRQMGRNITGNTHVAILPPPVDVQAFSPQGRAFGSRIRVGMFARFDPVKGYPVFFAACRILKQIRDDFDIVVAGKNFMLHREEIAAMIAEAGLTDRTTVLGDLSDDAWEISRALSTLDIGVIASIGSEELSRIGLEYMACGVPIVATDVGGLPELVRNDVGLVVPAGSPERLAEAIHTLMEDGQKRRQFGENARKTVVENHSIEVYCQRLADYYSSVCHMKTSDHG